MHWYSNNVLLRPNNFTHSLSAVFQVGSFLKSPKFPIWILGSETHLSVFFTKASSAHFSLSIQTRMSLTHTFLMSHGLLSICRLEKLKYGMYTKRLIIVPLRHLFGYKNAHGEGRGTWEMGIVIYGYSSFLAFTYSSIKGRNSPTQEEHAQIQTHILSAALFLSLSRRQTSFPNCLWSDKQNCARSNRWAQCSWTLINDFVHLQSASAALLCQPTCFPFGSFSSKLILDCFTKKIQEINHCTALPASLCLRFHCTLREVQTREIMGQI